MKRFKNILIVFNGKNDNQNLLYHAVELAKRNQTSLNVVDVIEEKPPVVDRLLPPLKPVAEHTQDIKIIEEFPSDKPKSASFTRTGQKGIELINPPKLLPIKIKELLDSEEQRDFEQFVKTVQEAGIQVKSKKLYGIPFVEVIRETLRNQHDLVMISAEGREGIKDTIFGSTTMHLLRKCPCPVWVIKPGRNEPFKRILAAIDLDQNDEVRIQLNKKIIEMATSLTRLGENSLLIFNAWSMVGESIIRGRGTFTSEQIENLLQETKDARRKQLITFLQPYPLNDINYEVYLLKGEAGSLIPEVVRVKEIEMIVMGTLSRTGIAGVLIGNTAEKVLQQVDCSILAIKPDGFVTPIKLE